MSGFFVFYKNLSCLSEQFLFCLNMKNEENIQLPQRETNAINLVVSPTSDDGMITLTANHMYVERDQ